MGKMRPGYCVHCKTYVPQLQEHLETKHGAAPYLTVSAAKSAQDPPTPEMRTGRASRTLQTCSQCGAQVRSTRLQRHLSKVHSSLRKAGRSLKPKASTSGERGLSVGGTVDLLNQCAAITRGGTRCSRPIAIPMGNKGFCEQHFWTNSNGSEKSRAAQSQPASLTPKRTIAQKFAAPIRISRKKRR